MGVPENYLWAHLPRAGMVYPTKNLLQQQRRDDKILRALTKHGIIERAHGVLMTQNQEAVDQALADMFNVALQPHIVQCQEGWGGVLAIFITLKRYIPWAAKIKSMIFIHLCCALVKARYEWHKNPRPPFDINEHRAVAKSIDAFLKVVGDDDDWWDANHFFFALPNDAINSDEESDEEEDKEVKTPETITHPVATSSSNVNPTDDSDINMSGVGTALGMNLAHEETDEEEMYEEMDEDMDMDMDEEETDEENMDEVEMDEGEGETWEEDTDEEETDQEDMDEDDVAQEEIIRGVQSMDLD
ncbi:hypothetical protein F4805DRAFT_444906 [Annulohypoxylon moriforme]|nr:hypothetical protein F4805DRAFT_444906 [Annulohypoxylon moriforme]